MAKVWQVASKYSNDLIEQLLYSRGIKAAQEKEEFFHPKLETYEKEFDLLGIKTAVKRIKEVVRRKELIVIFGDYDADGVCGTAVLYLGLTEIGAKVLPYIPHREKEGYGLSKVGLDFAKEQGASLVITVDNGIVALEAAEYAKSLGLDLIVTDHHARIDKKPKALSIIHSTKMSGAAVGWCLIRQLMEKEQANKLLDLVAIATITDLLPLLGVNRALTSEGLKCLNKTKRVGLRALISAAGLELGTVTSYHVGHFLGPRLNAIGRIEHAMDSLRLLCTKDQEKAVRLSRVLCEANDQKKKLTTLAITQAVELVQTEYKDGLSKENVLILHSKEWIPGIIGLIAGRMAEEYSLPTVVISEGQLQSKGSARSAGGIDIAETVRKCSPYLIDVGGHPKAAGFTLESDKITIFKKRLREVMKDSIVDQNEKLQIEALIPTKVIARKLLNDLQQLEPTGVENPAPVLASLGVRLSHIRTVGNGEHLKFVADGIDAIGFGLGRWASLLKDGGLIDLAYLIELNKFNGKETIQLKVLDIQLN